MTNMEKIGTTEFITVKTHARQLYLPLKKDLLDAFDIRKGDLLKVKIEGRVKREGVNKLPELPKESDIRNAVLLIAAGQNIDFQRFLRDFQIAYPLSGK